MYLPLVILFVQTPSLPTSGELLASFDAACAKLVSFDISVRCKGSLNYACFPSATDFRAKNTTHEMGFRHRYSRGRSRVEYLRLKAESAVFKNCIITYDGIEGCYFDREKNIAHIAKYGPVALPQLYTNLFLEAMLGIPYPRVLKERAGKLLTVWRQGDLVVLSVAAAPTQKIMFNNSSYDFYFDLKKGFVPCQIDVFRTVHGKKILYSRIANELALVKEPAAWVPVKSRRTSYVISEKSIFFGKEFGTEEFEVDLVVSRFNGMLEDNLFSQVLPASTLINKVK